MFLFQKKEEKTNYWKVVGITLGSISAMGAAGVAVSALLKRDIDTNCPATMLNLHPDVTLVCTADVID